MQQSGDIFLTFIYVSKYQIQRWPNILFWNCFKIWRRTLKVIINIEEIFITAKIVKFMFSNRYLLVSSYVLYILMSKLLFERRCLSFRLSEWLFFCKKPETILNGCTYQKMLVWKVVTFLKRIKMAILFLDFFGSDPSKIDQTHKFGEQTSRILEFKPKRLDF